MSVSFETIYMIVLFYFYKHCKTDIDDSSCTDGNFFCIQLNVF